MYDTLVQVFLAIIFVSFCLRVSQTQQKAVCLCSGPLLTLLTQQLHDPTFTDMCCRPVGRSSCSACDLLYIHPTLWKKVNIYINIYIIYAFRAFLPSKVLLCHCPIHAHIHTLNRPPVSWIHLQTGRKISPKWFWSIIKCTGHFQSPTATICWSVFIQWSFNDHYAAFRLCPPPMSVSTSQVLSIPFE